MKQDQNYEKGNGGRIFLVMAVAVIVLVMLVAGVAKLADSFGKKNEEPANTPEPTISIAAMETLPQLTEAPSALPTATLEPEVKEEKGSSLTIFKNDMEPEVVAKKVMPSVVCIQNYQTVSYGFPYGNRETVGTIELAGEGSGVILTQDGYIATNAHVIDGAELLKVMLADGEVYQAELIGSDPDTDLALVKIDAMGLDAAEIGDSDSLEIAETVMAIGNPGGSEYANSVTLGIVSAKNRQLDYIGGGYTLDMIQTDAAINPGNSGGALVNMQGEVVGICSMKYVDTRYEGLGFAISTKEAMPILNELMQYGKVVTRSGLGIEGYVFDETMAEYYGVVEGMYVSAVNNKNAGDLAVGDIITAINGEKTLTLQQLKAALKNKAPGETVDITYYRASEKKEMITKLTLVALNAAE
ncbi:MAG: trypsin-like peptidase domain-containing protein [Christensenellaceae bacterium]|nr:trypsin-like peptidase domain-containing protein [Christensenellaceae bacterium]